MFKLTSFAAAAIIVSVFSGQTTYTAKAGEQKLLGEARLWKRIQVGRKPPTQFKMARDSMEVVADRSVAFLYR